MRRRAWLPWWGGWLLALGLCWGVSGGASDRHGTRLAPGVKNFHQVNDRLFRGAQPDEAGLRQLRRLGVKTVVNLRMPNDQWTAEPRLVEGAGMAYTNIPLHSLERPTDEQVAAVLAVVENAPAPVFIHCQYGADRTGTIIACYRIKHDGWSAEKALSEAERLGMSSFETGMKEFVRDYESALRSR